MTWFQVLDQHEADTSIGRQGLSSAVKLPALRRKHQPLLWERKRPGGAFRPLLGLFRLVRRGLRRVFSDFGPAGEVAIGVFPSGR